MAHIEAKKLQYQDSSRSVKLLHRTVLEVARVVLVFFLKAGWFQKQECSRIKKRSRSRGVIEVGYF